jgi:hypothetical protein
MLCRRHSNKPKKWLASKYWQSTGGKWVFTASGITKHRKRLYQVMRLGSLGIRRYIIIEADANPSARICRLFLAAQARQGVALTPDDVGSGILGYDWRQTAGALPKGVLWKCLSRMRGNSQVRFLGGKGAERPLTYPRCYTR